jgi:hypothetical protein
LFGFDEVGVGDEMTSLASLCLNAAWVLVKSGLGERFQQHFTNLCLVVVDAVGKITFSSFGWVVPLRIHLFFLGFRY